MRRTVSHRGSLQRFLRWAGYLGQTAVAEYRRPIAPAFARPTPKTWANDRITLSWLGHATVLINFFGIRILTDPVLFSRVGIRLPGMTLGPKRLTAPALQVAELPPIDVILLSHAHFDHFDMRTLHRFRKSTKVVCALNTSDLLRWTRLREITELRWGSSCDLETEKGSLLVTALPVRHWGARLQTDDHRGYNGYLLERRGRRILFGGDTAFTRTFRELRDGVDIAILPIGCYNPWIRSHCSPEEAVEMADDARADFIVPIHHQTFRLSHEPFREPIERLEAVLSKTPGRLAVREIGQTFVMPSN